MEKEIFLEKLKKILQTEETLTMDTKLEDIEEWDSLGMMVTASFLQNECHFKTTVVDLLEYSLISELYNKVYPN